MKGHTHLLFALLLGILYFRYIGGFGLAGKIIFAVALIFGALLPDIDQENSIIGQKNIFARLMRHRGLMHSIWIPVIVYVIASLTEIRTLIGFVIGYSSHLFADALTIYGIKPFAPLSGFVLKGWMKTGGLGEWLILTGIVSYIILTA